MDIKSRKIYTRLKKLQGLDPILGTGRAMSVYEGDSISDRTTTMPGFYIQSSPTPRSPPIRPQATASDYPPNDPTPKNESSDADDPIGILYNDRRQGYEEEPRGQRREPTNQSYNERREAPTHHYQHRMDYAHVTRDIGGKQATPEKVDDSDGSLTPPPSSDDENDADNKDEAGQKVHTSTEDILDAQEDNKSEADEQMSNVEG
ncbi:hypothetical protein ACMFMF_005310 [Clarireedia jacksonii]